MHIFYCRYSPFILTQKENVFDHFALGLTQILLADTYILSVHYICTCILKIELYLIMHQRRAMR